MASETLDDAALAEAQEAPLSTVLHSHAAWVEEYGAPGLARALDRYATRAEALESDLATARAELARVTEERDALKQTVDDWAGLTAAHTYPPEPPPTLTTTAGPAAEYIVLPSPVEGDNSARSIPCE